MANGETNGQVGNESQQERPDEDHQADEDVDREPADQPDSIGGNGPEPQEPRGAWYHRMSRIRKFGLPIVTLILLGVIFLSFHSIMLPFIFAVVIVYLMEPVVKRLSPRLPRWAAVILVYLTFFGVVSISMLVVVPRFVEEIVRFAQTVPETINEFRKDQLPGINEDVQDFLQSYLPVDSAKSGYAPAQKAVHDALDKASTQSLAFGAAHRAVHEASDVEIKMRLVRKPRPDEADDGAQKRDTIDIRGALDERGPPGDEPVEYERQYRVVKKNLPEIDLPDKPVHGVWTQPGREPKPLARFVPSKEGGFELYLNEREVELEKVGEHRWKVHRAEPEQADAPETMSVRSVFDLEDTVNEMIEGAVSTSNERIGSLIGYIQLLVVGIVNAFVSIILTFMVAAFISIDLPSFIRFFSGLLPEGARAGYRDLLQRLDKGLAGVVRGQLLICLINGILTYIGLFLLDIKFSVLLAVVAGVLSLIPIFGTIISTIPIVVIGLMDGFLTGVLALAWILGIHFVEANILNPQIIGTSAHIHPVIVIFALLAGESAFGLVGALLAVPAASILLTLFKFVRERFFNQPAQ